MDSFFPRFKNALVLVLLLLAQAIGLAVQIRRPVESGAPDGRHVTLVRSWAVALVSPFERTVDFIRGGLSGAWMNYVDLRNVRQQDAVLRQQMTELRLLQTALAEDALAGGRLEALLAFQQHYVSETVAAQVVGASGSDLSRVVYLNKGSADGLRPDMPVMTTDGIVGKVRDVFPATAPHTAQVLLLNDQTSGAGVILANTRVRAIVHGTTAGQVMITNLTSDDRIKPGEPVVTSGGDLVFPRGLPVGTVESIAADPTHQPYTVIRVKPAANLFQLDEVLVVTGTQAQLPAAALQELRADAATTAATRAASAKAASEAIAAKAAVAKQQEEAARTAAEIVADRLPSLNGTGEANAAAADADATGMAKQAGSAVPRPLPTVHPDRYSPGTTPPAVDLTPGAPRQGAPPRPTPSAPEP